MYVCICVYIYLLCITKIIYCLHLQFFYLSKYIIIYLSFISKYKYNVIICILLYLFIIHTFLNSKFIKKKIALKID